MSPRPAIDISPAASTPPNQPPKLTVLCYHASLRSAPAAMPLRGAKAKPAEDSDSDDGSTGSSDEKTNKDSNGSVKESRRASHHSHAKTSKVFDDNDLPDVTEEDDQHASGSRAHGKGAKGHAAGRGTKARADSVTSMKGRRVGKVTIPRPGESTAAVAEISLKLPKASSKVQQRASNLSTIAHTGESTDDVLETELPKAASKVRQRASTMSTASTASIRTPKGKSPSKIIYEEIEEFESLAKRNALPNISGTDSTPHPLDKKPSGDQRYPLSEINEEDEEEKKTEAFAREATDSQDIKLDVASDAKAAKERGSSTQSRRKWLSCFQQHCCARGQHSDSEVNSDEQTKKQTKKQKRKESNEKSNEKSTKKSKKKKKKGEE